MKDGLLEEGSQLQSPGGGSPLEGGGGGGSQSGAVTGTGEGSRAGAGTAEGRWPGLGPAGLGILQGKGVELPV